MGRNVGQSDELVIGNADNSKVFRKYRIRNEYITASVGIVDIRDKMREHQPHCFGGIKVDSHVYISHETAQF